MINKNMARDLLADLPQGVLTQEDVQVESVSQIGGNEAVIETNLHAAFRYQKVGGKWQPREVRLGHAEWENVDNIVSALRQIKESETRKLLERISDALDKYWAKNGRLPHAQGFVALSDALTPDYLSPLVRLDAWKHPLVSESLGATIIRLSSAGNDGQFGTDDDIQFTRDYSSR